MDSPFLPVIVTADWPAFPVSSTFTSPPGVDIVLDRLQPAMRSTRDITTIRYVNIAAEVYMLDGGASRHDLAFAGETIDSSSSLRRRAVWSTGKTMV